jgi:hypothetical protein
MASWFTASSASTSSTSSSSVRAPSRKRSRVLSESTTTFDSPTSPVTLQLSEQSCTRNARHSNERLRREAVARFVSVLSSSGLCVTKHCRSSSRRVSRVVRFSGEQLTWDSKKWFLRTERIPLRDVLDVEQDGNIVWVKTLHLGKIGIETTFEKDATVIYHALDALLDERVGGPAVGDDSW